MLTAKLLVGWLIGTDRSTLGLTLSSRWSAPAIAVVALFCGEVVAQAPAPSSVAVELPAADRQSTVIAVPAIGRWLFRAESTVGVKLQLIDAEAGPIGEDGEIGKRDGRIDALLEEGRYKLTTRGPAAASGAVKITGTPFVETAPPDKALAWGETVSQPLNDGQQYSAFVTVESGAPLVIDAVGRSLADIRLWAAGELLFPSTITRAEIEPSAGQLMTQLTLVASPPPGMYRVTAYGGPPLIWGGSSNDQPFHLSRPDDSLPIQEATINIGPMGMARLRLPQLADTLLVTQSKPGGLRARLVDRSSGAIRARAELSDKSEDRDLVLRLSGENDLVLDAPTGTELRVTTGNDVTRSITLGSTMMLVASVASTSAEDSLPATILLTEPESTGRSLRVVESSLPRISAQTPWRVRFNLASSADALLEILDGGVYRSEAREGPGMIAPVVSLTPLTAGAASGVGELRPGEVNVTPGYYRISFKSIDNKGGIVDFTFSPAGQSTADLPFSAPPAPFRVLRPGLPTGGRMIYGNQRGRAPTLVMTQSTPLSQLGQLSIPIAAGEVLTFPLSCYGPAIEARLDATGS